MFICERAPAKFKCFFLRRICSTNFDCFVRHSSRLHLTLVVFCIAFCLLPVIRKQFYVISTVFLSRSRRRYSSRNVLRGEKRGETAVFADYVKFELIFLMNANIIVITPPGNFLASFLGLLPTWTTKTTTVVEPFSLLSVDF